MTEETVGHALPHVSVIVPARNSAGSLSLLLQSLCTQTYRDFEVVVVDDGSADSTALVVESAGRKGLRMSCLRTDGVGAVRARCMGVERAGGEVLAFTDSDCIADPRWLAAGVAAVDAGADVVQGRTVPQRAVGPLERSIAYSGRDGLFATCNVFYRRSAYKAAGGFDRSAEGRLKFRPTAGARGLGFGEDTLLGWRVKRSGRSAYAPGAIVRHEVVRPSVAETLSRAWMAGAFPRLVREAPELARTVLRGKLFLGGLGRRHLVHGIALCLAAGLAGAQPSVVRGVAGALGASWVGSHAWTSFNAFGPRKARVMAFAVELTIDVVTSSALVAGSVRGRKVVL